MTPFFEEPSVRETLDVPAEVRTWLEHEDALAVVASWLRDRKLASGVIGIEETTRYFIVDGLTRNLPGTLVRNGAVVRGCRLIAPHPSSEPDQVLGSKKRIETAVGAQRSPKDWSRFPEPTRRMRDDGDAASGATV